MSRVFARATAFLAFIHFAAAGDQPESGVKAFAKDIEHLRGMWIGPKVQFAPGVTGRFSLRLEFKKDSTVGQASVPNFVSKNGVAVKGPTWTIELKEKDKKRFIILAETKDDKRVVLAEIAYEVNEDRLKLTSSKTVLFEKGGNPIEMSGEWERPKVDKEKRSEPIEVPDATAAAQKGGEALEKKIAQAELVAVGKTAGTIEVGAGSFYYVTIELTEVLKGPNEKKTVAIRVGSVPGREPPAYTKKGTEGVWLFGKAGNSVKEIETRMLLHYLPAEDLKAVRELLGKK